MAALNKKGKNDPMRPALNSEFNKNSTLLQPHINLSTKGDSSIDAHTPKSDVTIFSEQGGGE